MPSTSQKFIRRGTLLHELWLLARQKLPSCATVVFIGYSFPLTDFYSQWLFRQTCFLKGTRPDIVVNPEVMKKRGPVARRYQRIFRGCTMHSFPTLRSFWREGVRLLDPG